MDFPQGGTQSELVLSTVSPDSLGVALLALGLSPGSSTWPEAETALFIPFRIHRATPWSYLFAVNGAVQDGNLDLGIYTVQGRRLASTTSISQSGSQGATIGSSFVSGTSILLHPGRYFMGLVFDGTTAEVYGWDIDVNVVDPRALGILTMASAFPLPATITPAGSRGFIPYVALAASPLIFS